MSTKLQQVIARSRLSTLDGDLREAGEQMLRDKFFPKNNSTEIDRDILYMENDVCAQTCLYGLCW